MCCLCFSPLFKKSAFWSTPPPHPFSLSTIWRLKSHILSRKKYKLCFFSIPRKEIIIRMPQFVKVHSSEFIYIYAYYSLLRGPLSSPPFPLDLYLHVMPIYWPVTSQIAYRKVGWQFYLLSASRLQSTQKMLI
jgi:hypothetical protein